MKITRQINREAKVWFRWCLVNGQLDEDRVRQVAQAISEHKRRGYLALLSQFQRLVRLEWEAHTAEIASAVPLQDDMHDRVSADLQQLYGPGLRTRFVHRPALIGGMRVTVGSDVYDGSVQFRLAELEKSFTVAEGYAA
jgi:F-type H+-transporting ATPase subunit delta